MQRRFYAPSKPWSKALFGLILTVFVLSKAVVPVGFMMSGGSDDDRLYGFCHTSDLFPFLLGNNETNGHHHHSHGHHMDDTGQALGGDLPQHEAFYCASGMLASLAMLVAGLGILFFRHSNTFEPSALLTNALFTNSILSLPPVRAPPSSLY